MEKILNFSSIESDRLTPSCKFMSQNSKIWGSKKFSKIGTFWLSKQPIGDLFKNPNQGM